MLTHKRLMDIMDATSKTVQELQRLNLSAGDPVLDRLRVQTVVVGEQERDTNVA